MFGYKQINDANMLENRMNLVQICKDDLRRYKNRDIQMCIDIAQLMFQKGLETIKKRYRQKIDKEVVMMICALTGSRRLELIISKEEGKKDQILQFIQEMIEKGYTDEMILGIKSVTKQLLKQAKLSH